MNSIDERIIQLSKKKIVLVILGASTFAAMGLWMFLRDDETIRSSHGPWFFSEPLIVHGVGLSAILFFSLIVPFALKQLFNKKPGLVFNASGMIDNASFVSAGFIPWSDVVGAEIYQTQGQKILMIMVRDPQKYINRGSAFRRKLNKANAKMGGSPIGISSVALKIDFQELLSLFNEYQRKYGGDPSTADMRHHSSDK